MRRDDLVVTRWGARFNGRRLPCAIGRGGVTKNKREGDGATPAGARRLLGGFFRADRLASPAPGLALTPVGPADKWSDDPADAAYNTRIPARFYPHSHERMRRGDGLYDIVIMTDWNFPNAEPGRGSAIFVHCWKAPRRPTEGCVAFRRCDLVWILERWTARSRMIVQG